MKPIIIKPNDQGLICFTEEELQKLIDEVYAQGKADGTTYGPYICPSNIPSNPYNPLQPYITWMDTKTAPVPSYRDQWTCADTSIGSTSTSTTRIQLNEDGK